jgi:hypothetical protein
VGAYVYYNYARFFFPFTCGDQQIPTETMSVHTTSWLIFFFFLLNSRGEFFWKTCMLVNSNYKAKVYTVWQIFQFETRLKLIHQKCFAFCRRFSLSLSWVGVCVFPPLGFWPFALCNQIFRENRILLQIIRYVIIRRKKGKNIHSFVWRREKRESAMSQIDGWLFHIVSGIF